MKKKEKGQGKPQDQYLLPASSNAKAISLIVVLGATTPEKRTKYRAKLTTQDVKICELGDSKKESSEDCALYYVFMVGGNPTGSSEQIESADGLVKSSDGLSTDENDLIFLDIQ